MSFDYFVSRHFFGTLCKCAEHTHCRNRKAKTKMPTCKLPFALNKFPLIIVALVLLLPSRFSIAGHKLLFHKSSAVYSYATLVRYQLKDHFTPSTPPPPHPSPPIHPHTLFPSSPNERSSGYKHTEKNNYESGLITRIYKMLILTNCACRPCSESFARVIWKCKDHEEH